jgi:predicted nuclease with TOPRIM domain
MPKQIVGVYAPPDRKESWEEHADEMGMSTSEWANAMIEAGLKKFDRDIQPDESKRDLRRRNTELWNDFQALRKERDRLEKQLHQTERRAILEFVEENNGCRYKEIAKHLSKNKASRLTKLLDALDGQEIEIDEDGHVYRL